LADDAYVAPLAVTLLTVKVTLVFDLLTPGEDATEFVGRHLCYNMGLLTQRLICAAHWLAGEDEARHLRLGFLGFETGGGAALVAAADLPEVIGAVVVQSGRVDLAGGALRRVKCPTLLLVDQQDEELAELIGSTREVVTGMMIEFRQRGLIDYKRGDIRPNLPGLIHFVTHST